ncbi:MAG TPA: alpha/beta hydrolase [Solirubrobacteraceae bacterium]|nr:alpha/beta hydrolase [Solirubrobacteraceae bacterium]
MAALPSYSERGSGPAIVCSHGTMMDRRLFEPQLAGLGHEFRVIAYDLRARGERGEEPYDLYDLADDFVGLLDGLAIERCVLVGMSMGGFMAVRAALRYPERVAGIVLLGSSALPYTPESRTHWEAHFGSVRDTQPIDAAFARADAEAHFSARTTDLDPELVELWVERFGTRSGMETFREVLSWTRQDDVRDQLSQLQTPSLVIHGDEDELVSLDDAYETYLRLPNARLQVVPYASHAVNLEAPHAVNAAIATFAGDVLTNLAEINPPDIGVRL